METLKFKVGNKVRVKSLEWYNENKNEKGDIYTDGNNGVLFTKIMSDLCGSILRIIAVEDDHYTMSGIVYYWQDWMLEDEVITAEEQQLKTKEMTKKEVFAYLGSTKILCTSTEETAKVQEKLFELGISWMYDGRNVREDKYLLFVNSKGCISYCSEINNWMEDNYKRIEPSEILAITLKEEKPKFDPKTLQPYDKVLVRALEHEVWVARFFDYCECGFYYTTSSACSWKYCVPYCDETKHLHRTTLEAPEFYRIKKK